MMDYPPGTPTLQCTQLAEYSIVGFVYQLASDILYNIYNIMLIIIWATQTRHTMLPYDDHSILLTNSSKNKATAYLVVRWFQPQPNDMQIAARMGKKKFCFGSKTTMSLRIGDKYQENFGGPFAWFGFIKENPSLSLLCIPEHEMCFLWYHQKK